MNNISDVEEAASSLFAVLRQVKLSPELEEVRDYLFPEGMIPVVQLEEDGRKKRSTAAARNWNPRLGEIRIFLEPLATVAMSRSDQWERIATEAISSPSAGDDSWINAAIGAASAVPKIPVAAPTAPVMSAVQKPLIDVASAPSSDRPNPEEVIECCQALASAEKSNRQFIALKWFRESFLPTLDFPWTRSPQRRQRVLSEAIDLGRIDAKKIPNPKSEFPTMTISLNRSMPIPGIAPRFQPVSIRGEAVSETLLRDRGSL